LYDTVGTGAAALAALKAGHFDCVVLDLGLPDITGFELIEQIKQEVSLSKLLSLFIPERPYQQED